jgi:hypothetical protein
MAALMSRKATAILGLCIMLQGWWCTSIWAQSPEPRITIAVLDFVLNLALANADEAERDQLPVRMASDAMRTQVTKSAVYRLVDTPVEAHVASLCNSDTCALQVGKALGVQRVLWGEVTKASALIWYVSVRMIDTQTAMPWRVETVQFRGNITEVMPRVVAILWRRLHETE